MEWGEGVERRSVIKATGGILGAVSVAGCSEERTSTPTQRREPTATSTPTRTTTEDEESSQDIVEYDEVELDDEDVEDAIQEEDEGPDGRYLQGLSGLTAPPDVSGSYSRRYEWTALGYEWWLELQIPKRLTEYYDSRLRQNDRGFFVSDPYDDTQIRTLADEFENMGRRNDLSDREIIDLAMAFVQQLEYTPDIAATGYNQYTLYPIETLNERGGDCEDTAILLAAILEKMGYGCVLLGMWEIEHMALGVKGDPSIPGSYYEYNGSRYYYVETTASGWGVGEVPDQARGARAEIQEIKGHPTLVYTWEASVSDRNDLHIAAAVRNVGDQVAFDVTLVAELENQAEIIRSNDEATFGSISPDQSSTATLQLSVPEEETLRVRTGLIEGDSLHDMDTSDWRQPY